MIMITPKKLIEVAMPIKEISAESVRDKSIRHGHISTLHLWWARRPLPVCRAVVFASLVPDPLDENCPQQFRDAVEILLGSAERPLRESGIDNNAYTPYDKIPYTAAADTMEDNARNRLLMFIGKYSKEFCDNEKTGKSTPSGKQLSAYSLIKWDNKNNEQIIGKARKLIWVSHNSYSNLSAEELLKDFDKHYKVIKDAEQELYSISDRHIETDNIKSKTVNLNKAIEAFLNKMPKVFDPFAGGGAIPLEAARLGCRSFGNDINPVAHIIQKGSLEFPQKYGKPITYTKTEFIKIYGEEEWQKQPNEILVFENGMASAVNIANRLSFDVDYYAKKLLAETEKEIGHLYPPDKNGNKPVAYYWARVGTCSNPTCKANIPLLRNFILANTKSKQVYLFPIISNKEISFEVKFGKCELEGWNHRGNLKCPCCQSITDVKLIKEQSKSNLLNQRILAVIYDGPNGKEYRIPCENEITVTSMIPNSEAIKDKMQRNSAGGDTFSWGIMEWGQMFLPRQLYAMHVIVKHINKLAVDIESFDKQYNDAIITYLAILLNRLTPRSNMFGLWNTIGEKIEHVFGRQAIPMVFDYPELNVFSTSGGGGINQLSWITRFINSEENEFYSTCINASSGDKNQFEEKSVSAVITDPPYYDAIAYADLSDFFYVWFKKTLSSIYPMNFVTPQTPKTDECTALKHHHGGDAELAKRHFEKKLTQIFGSIEHQTSDIVSIMFAHQSTDAWTTLCNSILDSNMNITGSWAIDTERSSAGVKATKAFLSSSVTVSCQPTLRNGLGDFREVKKAIEHTVEKEVAVLYSLGFRGADLITACFGQAVSEFGKYEKVEKADGSEVTVAELLEMARESAFNALLKGFDGDDFTKFYIGWLQLYSLTESDFDDAAKFSRVGLSINVSELFNEHILIKNGNKQTLGTFEQRNKANKNLGEKADSFLIDHVHKAMALYKGSNRNALLQYISKVASQPENSFWRVVTSICEVLPSGSNDQIQALGLLTNKESLIRESKSVQIHEIEQPQLFE